MQTTETERTIDRGADGAAPALPSSPPSAQAEPPGPLGTIAPIDSDALDALLGRMVGDMGAAVNGALVILGDRLGIYRAMAEAGPVTSQALAERTGLNERQLREWLSAQAASGYVTYAPEPGTFSLTPEQAAVFADPHSPAAMTGGFYSISSVYHDEPRIAESFRTGRGVSWGDHHSCLFCGVERFFRPGYEANLVEKWIPALDGVLGKLQSGIRVADIGCGHGASTIIMAKAFPRSRFVGFDIHPGSVEAATRRAAEAEVTNVEFRVASAQDFPGHGYGFVTIFDALHDMGDPVGACVQVRKALDPDGTLMIIEPMAGDSLTDNLNPLGRVYYGFSTMVCLPTSLSQPVALGLGAQAGERRLRGVLNEGGFSQVRRATETPFNMVLEAKA